MKKTLLLFALASMATMGYAQAEPDDLERVEGFFWKYDDVNKTATIISSYRWHSHGTLPDGSDDMVMGNCHCYSGDVVIPETAPNGYTVTGIGDQCFNGCDGLTSVKLPQTLKTIGELAFQLCTKLTGISIPASVERLEHGCFNGAAIETLTIEDSDNPITKLDLNRLPNLKSLYGLNMPLKRIHIGQCHHLRTIELSHTELDTFSLAPFPELVEFFCIHSPLRSLDLTPCPALESLYIRGTLIREVDITPCAASSMTLRSCLRAMSMMVSISQLTPA